MMLNFNSYEDLKDKLQIRIYDPDFSRNLLEGKVVTYVGDFALVYMATLYKSEKGLGNLMFTPELMDALGIDTQTLHRDADQGGQYWYTDKNGKKKLGLINKRSDEGDWTEWKDALPSQFLSKQSKAMAEKQLGIARADRQAEYEAIMALTNPTVKKSQITQKKSSLKLLRMK